MKRLTASIFIAFILSSICIASNPAYVVYSFGKIEVLKSGQPEWQFLKKETPLFPDDIVRMPPISLLRLKDAEGNFLPIFTGSRELTVTEIIDQGKIRLKQKKGRQIGSSFNSRPAVDILPTGDRVDTAWSSTDEKVIRTQAGFSKKELKKIEILLNTIPKEVEEYARQKIDHLQFFDDGYPNQNLFYARNLFMTLNKATEDRNLANDDRLKRVVLYSQFLKSVGVPIHLTIDDNAKPVVMFDTEISQGNIKLITANRNLVSSRNGTLWVCVSMESTDNFTLAWYKGSKSK